MNEDVIKYLPVYLNIDSNNQYEVDILNEAIRFADDTKYHRDKLSYKDHIETEIFLTKASNYFRYKTLDPFKDFVEINNIKSSMHNKIKFLNRIKNK